MNRIALLFTIAALGTSVACAPGSQADPQPTPQPEPAQADEPTQEEAQRAAFAASERVASVRVSPSRFELNRGDTATLHVTFLDRAGSVVRGPAAGIRGIGALDLDRREGTEGPQIYTVEAVEPGSGALEVLVARRGTGDQPEIETLESVPVVVHEYPLARVEIDEPGFAPYVGTTIDMTARAMTTRDTEHATADLTWSSLDPSIVRITPEGRATFVRPGNAAVLAQTDDLEHEARYEFDVRANPVASVGLSAPDRRLRTGDVMHLDTDVADRRGRAVDDIRVSYQVDAVDGPDTGATVFDDGAFVAEDAGRYRITAQVGDASDETMVDVRPRETSGEISRVGHGPVGTATSDLWVFEGRDGRDYAYTGTMRAATMYAWDVTDPENPVKVDSITVDGRRVNDVKINDDRTLAIVTSENASNRRNGITVVDISDPANPEKISHFTENLTAGVHNVWWVEDLVYAVNDGTSAVHIIDVSDPANPREVGRWGLDNPSRYLHDVSVEDGLAYLSYWNDGLVILDVGAGIKGGTPTDPQFVSQYKYEYDIGGQTYGNTHHAIRYKDYVFVGDEIFGCPGCENPRGYLHVVDVSDIENPHEVAHYKLPEAGTHNLWVEDDKLYIAYYNEGLHIVDVSGELRGDLLAQGRQIASFATRRTGEDATETMAWGPQPYKGNIFVSDLNSGLWVVRLERPELTP